MLHNDVNFLCYPTTSISSYGSENQTSTELTVYWGRASHAGVTQLLLVVRCIKVLLACLATQDKYILQQTSTPWRHSLLPTPQEASAKRNYEVEAAELERSDLS